MITVILYGRNDAYGYNLHKRAAISVNCFAELLSDSDDEIIFVDYNTPNELPTFIEAIYDTLTDRARSYLRVLRVRPELHRKLVGHTHLVVIEPQPRNIAIRRSNPRNHWVLNTNTDMIFVPREGFRDLNDVFRDLPEGHYTLPRFELPEPLWESFPRADPAAILATCRDFGPRLHLDEVTLSLPESRYDQVGDFQLMPRQILFDVHGFDERMIHGWHCDSNIAKRLFLYYGSTGSLADRMKGYHCDHTRVVTGMHNMDMKVDNNVQQFVFSITDPLARHQKETWGIPDEPIEELDFQNDPSPRFSAAVAKALGAPQPGYYESDSNGMRNYVWCQPEHVLAYVAGELSVYPRRTRCVYIGNNPRTLELTTRSIAEMNFEHPLHFAARLLTSGAPPAAAIPVDAEPLPDNLLSNFDVLIFDFGLPGDGRVPAQIERVTDWPRDLRYSLGVVAQVLEDCAERAAKGGVHVPDCLTINANHHTFRDFVNQFLLLTFTPFATHVRRGRPRIGEERRYRSNNWRNTEDAMRSFFGYHVDDLSAPRVGVGDGIDFTSAGQPGRLKDGHWGATDYTGSWTDGCRAAIVFEPPARLERDVAAVFRVNEVFVGPKGDPIRVQVLLDGMPVADWSFFVRHAPVDAKAILPASQLAGKPTCRLELHVANPQSAARAAMAEGQQVIGDDPRMLGIKVQRFELVDETCFRFGIGDTLEFTPSGTGDAHTYNGWSLPDDLGAWTLGGRSDLRLIPQEPVAGRAQAIFAINDAAVNDDHPELRVRVLCDGIPVSTWMLGPDRDAGEQRVLLPPGAFQTTAPTTLSLEIAEPRTPVELGWSTWDKRPLGCRLSRLRIVPAGRLNYRLGDPVDFVDSGDSLVFVEGRTGTEWSLPGQRGSWTIGKRAGFRVPLESPVEADLPAAFVISDCVISAAQPTLEVTVKANGREVGSWSIRDRRPHCRSVHIPADVVNASRELLIEFDIPEPRSPRSLGWSHDARPLGFLLARAVIGRERADIPKFKAIGRDRPMYQRILGLPQYAMHVARILVRRYWQ